MYRAADGAQLLANLGYSCKAATPSDDGRGTIYLFESEYDGHSGAYGRLLAIELVAETPDRLGVRVRWGRLLQRGFLGGVTVAGEQLHLLEAGDAGQLWTVDRESGQVLQVRGDLFAFQAGNAYVPPSFAGGRLYLGEEFRL